MSEPMTPERLQRIKADDEQIERYVRVHGYVLGPTEHDRHDLLLEIARLKALHGVVVEKEGDHFAAYWKNTGWTVFGKTPELAIDRLLVAARLYLDHYKDRLAKGEMEIADANRQ